MVVHFHLLFNLAIAIGFLFFTEKIAQLAERLLPAKPDADDPAKARYLDPSALDYAGARDRQRRARGDAPRRFRSSRC